MYYDSNRVLVDEKYNGQKWYTSIKCELPPKKDSVIIYDQKTKTWKYQPLVGWNAYLVEIGNLKLAPTQKLDAKGNVINKTHEELYLEGLITKDEYVKIQTQIINDSFDNECSKVGVEFKGLFDILDSSEKITNPKFQYDDLSQNRLLKFKDISEVNFWRSVDNINIVMTNEQKNTLYSLLLLTWATKFTEKSQQIDTIGT